MKYDCDRILQWTQALLKYNHDTKMDSATPQQLHDALGQAVMMEINDCWTQHRQLRAQSRKAFYFSAEYLMGRLVFSNLYNLGILPEIREAFAKKGVDLSCMEEIEDAALGNGGLGRLAACFLDSAVSCDLPLSGYGLRYKFGLFKQRFDDNGSQRELADDWTHYGDPWSYRRDNHTTTIEFADQTVLAVPYDMPIIGYGTDNIGTLRLWQCEAVEELDFDAFNAQDYARALDAKNRAEDITRVLYPNDSTYEGKRLRIKQQYVISSASLQDILRVYQRDHGDLKKFGEFATIQYDPVEIANNLKKNGGFIPGFRPGKPTAEFIQKVINKIVVFGAIYLSVVALLPIIAGNLMEGVRNLAIGGTSVIIVVGVALETVKALEAQMLMRHYKGFLD